MVSVQLCSAETNDITSLIQRGLFEEEANHNLEAAMQAYQSAIAEHDKDRKLVATAIFRMGECYRKQGKSAEAAAQYERIVKEFSEQTPLVKLSRNNLGPAAQETQETTASVDPATSAEITALKSAYQETAKAAIAARAQWQRVQSFQTREDRIGYFTITKPDQPLILLVGNLKESETKLQETASKYGDQHPDYKAAKLVFENAIKNVTERIQALERVTKNDSDTLNLQETELKAKLESLSKAANTSKPATPSGSGTAIAQNPVTTSEEEEEIRKIKVMIKNSPDLINAVPNDALPPLCLAAYKGQLQVAEYLLANGALVNAPSHDGDSPLYYAAQKGHKAMVELLLSKGADLEAKNTLDNTALHIAVEKGYLNLTEFLLQRKANINAQNRYGWTPLCVASGCKSDSIDAPPQKAAVEMLLEHKADPNIPTRQGTTPLFYAAHNNAADVVKLLLDHGADVNATAQNGSTPLNSAVMSGHTDMVKTLLKAGAIPVRTSKGANSAGDRTGASSTLLSRAITFDSDSKLETINALLDAKADPNERFDWQRRNEQGGLSRMENLHHDCTPLMMACVGSPDIVETLLAHGANINSTSKEGLSALEFSIQSDLTTNALVLIAHKASLTPRSSSSSLLHHAVANRNGILVDALCKAGADVDAKDKEGNTPLAFATMNLDTNLVAILLANKADPNTANIYGRPPIASILDQGTEQSPERQQKINAIGEMLRKSGANENYKRSSSISYQGADSTTQISVFKTSGHPKNDYTLSDLLILVYGDYPRRRMAPGSNNRIESVGKYSPVAFPDFSKIRINRLMKDGTTNFVQVDFAAILESGDRTKTPHLVWGDIVEIPQMDHKVTDIWPGLDEKTRLQFGLLTYRNIKINVKGQVTDFTLLPRFTGTRSTLFETNLTGKISERIVTSFTISDVISEANVLLASSDTRYTKVHRAGGEDGGQSVFYVNLHSDPYCDLLLQNGDQITIPEKESTANEDADIQLAPRPLINVVPARPQKANP